MKIEFLELKNAYGIKELCVNLNGGKDNCFYQDIVYSRNGTFKTSFSKSLYELSNDMPNNVFDRITNEQLNIKIKIDGEEATVDELKDKFIVFSREIYERNSKSLNDYSKEIAFLTLDKKDNDYIMDLIAGDLEEPRLHVELPLKKVGLDYDKCLECLNIDNNLGDLDYMIELLKMIQLSAENVDISKITLKKIFQKPYNIIDEHNFKVNVDNYIEMYNNKLKEELFDDNFDDSNCLAFLSTLQKTNFMSNEKKRGIILAGKEYFDYVEVEKIFNVALENISKDPEIRKQSQDLVKNMGTSQEATSLKNDILKDPILVKQLSLGRKQIILAYLKQTGTDFQYWINILEKTKVELMRVYQNAKEKKNNFEKAIDIYEKRFHPTFRIKLKNKPESMLGLEMPTLAFYHNRAEEIELTESQLYDLLSSGEKTALNIIKFIVEYNNKKNLKPMIILDDIVETFDYANRYAFIEYINDLIIDSIPLIILTHNFEFYRNVSRRIDKLRRLVATSDKKGKVFIQPNSNINRDIERVLEICDEKSMIFALPFLREASTILREDTSLLDDCLHYNENTQSIKLSDILNKFPVKTQSRVKYDNTKGYLKALEEQSDAVTSMDDFDLCKKTIVALGCRIFIEMKIIDNDFNLLKDIDKYQTAQLKDKYGNELTEKTLNLLEKTILFTPEFIHTNSFMYEPLIDIDGKYLVDLLKDIKSLRSDEIWKPRKKNKSTQTEEEKEDEKQPQFS